MKTVYIIIGTMLVALCISPVAAVSGGDFNIVVDKSGDIDKYTYRNVNDPNEKYTEIYTRGTLLLHSCVTFKPRNIPDARTMYVNTNDKCYISLPRSVDEWVIKYYSKVGSMSSLDDKYLKNRGVMNLNKFFGENISDRLILELSTAQCFYPVGRPHFCYCIPDVD